MKLGFRSAAREGKCTQVRENAHVDGNKRLKEEGERRELDQKTHKKIIKELINTHIPDKIVNGQGGPKFPECSFEQQTEDFASSLPEGFRSTSERRVKPMNC